MIKIKLASSLILLTAILCLVSLAIYGLKTSSLRVVELEGQLVRTHQNEVMRIFKPWVNTNLMDIDIDYARTSVTALPWIKNVSLTRRWPQTLNVYVHEYQPVARWIDGRLFDIEGKLFAVPLKSQVNVALLSGSQGTQDQVFKKFTDLTQAVPNYLSNIISMRLNGAGSYKVEFGNGVIVLFDEHTEVNQIVAAMKRFGTAPLPQLHHVNQIDFRYHKGFAVKWRVPDRSEENKSEGAS